MELTTAIAEQTAAVTEQAMQYEFAVTPEKFVDALPIMGKGMLGIFIVMGIIIICVMLLNHFTSPDRKAKKLEKKNAKAAANANANANQTN